MMPLVISARKNCGLDVFGEIKIIEHPAKITRTTQRGIAGGGYCVLPSKVRGKLDSRGMADGNIGLSWLGV